MKDTLRYCLAEGMIQIFTFPDFVMGGKLRGTYHASDLLNGKVGVESAFGKNFLVVDGMAYELTAEFFMKYGTFCTSEEDALQKTVKLGMIQKDLSVTFTEICKQLESV